MSADLPKFQKYSKTSLHAAIEMIDSANNLRADVYKYLRKYGPQTDEQMQRGLGMNPSTQRPRRIELVERGLVRDSGEKRRTRSKRLAVIWEAVE